MWLCRVSGGVVCFVASYLRLNCWQKRCNSSLARVKPCHVLFDERIEDFVVSAPRLHLTKGEATEIVSTVCDPVENCGSSKYNTVFCHVAYERILVDCSTAVQCESSENEPVDNCKDRHREGSDSSRHKATEDYGYMAFSREAEQHPPADL